MKKVGIMSMQRIQPLITPTLRSASGQGKRPGGSLGSRTLRGVHDTMRK